MSPGQQCHEAFVSDLHQNEASGGRFNNLDLHIQGAWEAVAKESPAILLSFLATIPPDQRVSIMESLSNRFCPHCGYEQPSNEHCQYANDE